MTKKELKKFCNLSKYIEQIDPQFYDAMEKLCALYLLKPAKGSNGLTFLYPAEKAYREKIINGAYSPQPEHAIAMMRSLVIPENFTYPQHFTKSVINGLGQKIEIKSNNDKGVILENSLVLTRDDSFKPIDSIRSRVTVYKISGKGEIPINGPVADVSSQKKTGGSSSPRKELQTFLAKTYSGEIKAVDNIYVKKVAVQLYIIDLHRDGLVGKFTLTDYLGNDEFSDSYLLDMFCESEFPKCFGLVLDALKNDNKAMNATKAKYIEMKKKAVGSLVPNALSPSRLSGLKSIMEIRERVARLYNGDDVRMGKDLFIVFCNISRDVWQTEASEGDQISAFRDFAYLASTIYSGCCTDILKHEFDIARDLTLYGNLLKSDVCLYTPQAEFPASSLSEIPSPLDMSEYSLSSFINRQVKVGGGKYDASLLDGF
ncbi:MAG: hypothetical protein ACRCZI_07370 [Cetobacterium sp.]